LREPEPVVVAKALINPIDQPIIIAIATAMAKKVM